MKEVRMWNIHPKLLCDKHLIEEHKDMHFLAWALHDRRNPDLAPGAAELHNVVPRHNKLVREMKRRWPESDLCQNYPSSFRSRIYGEVDVWNNFFHLSRDCVACRNRIEASLIWFIDNGYSQIHKHQYLLNFIRELNGVKKKVS